MTIKTNWGFLPELKTLQEVVFGNPPQARRFIWDMPCSGFGSVGRLQKYDPSAFKTSTWLLVELLTVQPPVRMIAKVTKSTLKIYTKTRSIHNLEFDNVLIKWLGQIFFIDKLCVTEVKTYTCIK